MKKLILGCLVFLFSISLVYAEEDLAPTAKSAILIDASEGKKCR